MSCAPQADGDGPEDERELDAETEAYMRQLEDAAKVQAELAQVIRDLAPPDADERVMRFWGGPLCGREVPLRRGGPVPGTYTTMEHVREGLYLRDGSTLWYRWREARQARAA